MHESVTLLGGHLSAGPESGGGFVVAAQLPLGPPTSTPVVVAAEPRAAGMTTWCLIADDQAMVRRASPPCSTLRRACRSSARPRTERKRSVSRELWPDVVLMDVRMPVMDGLEATREILCPAAPGIQGLERPRVLMLTTFDLDDYVYDALRAGASGFLLKDAPAAELVHAVRVVAAGDALLACRSPGA
jgi:DNA-binding NarL/FixJ family response regulator